jgi:hypothetical protein
MLRQPIEAADANLVDQKWLLALAFMSVAEVVRMIQLMRLGGL